MSEEESPGFISLKWTRAELELLLPCPFCGSRPNLCADNSDGGPCVYTVFCGSHAVIRSIYREQARACWNSRVPVPTLAVAADAAKYVEAIERDLRSLKRLVTE